MSKKLKIFSLKKHKGAEIFKAPSKIQIFQIHLI